MKRLSTILFSVMLLIGTSVVNAAQVPTIHEVYQAAHSGHLAQAQKMMDVVLAAHPNSAKAHFVEAEILEAGHQYARASTELATAQHLKPGLPFENAQAIAALQARIQQGLSGTHARGVSSTHAGGSGVSWIVVLLVAGCFILLAMVIRALMTPKPMPAMYNGGVPPNNSMGAMGGNQVYPTSPMGGSGLMSGLTTGLGMGAGFAAGEAVVNHFLHGQNSAANTIAPGQVTQPMDDSFMGNNLDGNDFGMSDAGGWGDDSFGGDFSDSGGDDGWS